MAPRTNSDMLYFFKQYAYHRFCDEYTADGASKSLAVLYNMANIPNKQGQGLSREEQLQYLMPHLAKSMQSKISGVEDTISNIYKIDADCEDGMLLGSTIVKLRELLPLFKTQEKSELKVRTVIHNHIYDLYEQLYPSNKKFRFEELKQMVRDIKVNDGTFDYDPLNVAAKRIDYFMKEIPAQQRFALLSEIQNKTFDKNIYNYTSLLERTANEYYIEKRKAVWEGKMEHREVKQNRYLQIRNEELPNALDNQTKISLYKELLGLINSQEFGRTRKFNEKKTIYNHLIGLYNREGMEAEAHQMEIMRNKFLDARNIAKEAARRKGYHNKPSQNVANIAAQKAYADSARY